MKPDRVAVELNRDIVSRAQWPETALKEGDKLEVVQFVGGGLQMPLAPQLGSAIETLYLTFSKYPLHADTGACSCCHSSQDELVLHRKPLRALTLKDLSTYAMDAIYTWGAESDFKHFLPRLFELIAEFPRRGQAFVHPASVFAKLSYESSVSSPWFSWPNDERLAISEYFWAVWDAVLNEQPENLPFDGVHGWISAIAQAEPDLTKYLDHWLAASSVTAHRNLAAIISEQGLPNSTKITGGYWEGHRRQWQQLVAWLRKSKVKLKLTNGVEKWIDEPFATELFDAASLLP
jgi:hypothetical protein